MKVGVVGGGQLGQMLALAGIPLGIEVSCFDTSPDAPAARPGPLFVGQTDIYSMREWARTQDVLTYEFENFPSELISNLSEFAPVYPAVNALTTAQDRWAEKRLFDQLEISIAPFRTASTRREVDEAIADLDYPVVVKTRTGGYDGKGQVRVTGSEQMDDVDALLANGDVIVEKLIDFDYEISVIGVRSKGQTAIYPVTRNVHRDGILHSSIAPSAVPAQVGEAASKALHNVLKQLDYTGVLALEMFVKNGQLLANELAPRVHNSGHWTIEGAETSQFENHLRAVCGLPLGSTAARTHCAMINLIGTMPDQAALLKLKGAAIHVYGKSPRPGRKLGHVTVTADSPDSLTTRISAVEKLINC